MKITFLGTGTSVGVPFPGCSCKVCTSSDPRNQRLRTAVFIEAERGSFSAEGKEPKIENLRSDFGVSPHLPEDSPPATRILIDTPPDLRQQILRMGFRAIDAVFYTHAHADHINGIDDLRPINFKTGRGIKVFADRTTGERLHQMFGYAFGEDTQYQGGAPPKLLLNQIEPYQAVMINEEPVLPLQVMHGKMSILAYKIRNFAYVTDCSEIPDETRKRLQGLDVLVLSALRHREHPTHFTLEQAVREIANLRPKRAFLTHISHELEHAETNELLSRIAPCQTALAYDGLELEI